jgi:hypothetical protein
MFDIIKFFSQYELLAQTAKYLSTVDLISIAFSHPELYDLIRKNARIWDQLKREALCDGRGLEARQSFSGIYSEDETWTVRWRRNDGRTPMYDQEVEVRVWNLKCDAVNALPCVKCKINCCEVCDVFVHFSWQRQWQ